LIVHRDAGSRKYSNISFGYVDIDTAPDVETYLHAYTLPNFLFYVDSNVVQSFTGGWEDKLEKALNELQKEGTKSA